MPDSSSPLPRCFRWLRGMATDRHEVIYAAADEDGVLRLADPRGVVRHVRLDDMADRRPDLTDPATVGALAALVREAWGVPSAYAYPLGYDRGWQVSLADGIPRYLRGPTEGAAWWAALVDAP